MDSLVRYERTLLIAENICYKSFLSEVPEEIRNNNDFRNRINDELTLNNQLNLNSSLMAASENEISRTSLFIESPEFMELSVGQDDSVAFGRHRSDGSGEIHFAYADLATPKNILTVCTSHINMRNYSGQKINSPENCSLHGSIFNRGFSKENTLQISIPKVSVEQRGTAKSSILQVCGFKNSIGEAAIFQNDFSQVCVGTKVNCGKMRIVQIGPIEISSTEIASLPSTMRQISTAQISTTQINSREISFPTTQINSSEIPLSSSISLKQLLGGHFSNFHNQYPQINTLRIYMLPCMLQNEVRKVDIKITP